MKITKNNYNYLQSAVGGVLDKYPNIVEAYETGKFSRADGVKDLQRRFCFDVLFGAGISQWVSTNLYGFNDLDDDHIFTALKSICPTVIRRY